MSAEVIQISSKEELISFFADFGTSSRRAAYGSHAVEAFYDGKHHPLLAFLGGLIYALAARGQDATRGMHLRVFFAQPLGERFHVASRPEPTTGEPDAFKASFMLAASLEPRIRQTLGPARVELLVSLARRFPAVRANERWFSFGPMLGTPTESAETVDGVLRQLREAGAASCE